MPMTEAWDAFDLNVERILEHWTPAHALREVIANALDEHALVGNESAPVIAQDADGAWHVRDSGRGLRYQHLTQNESEEKKDHPGVVGQFGVGLKDALATFFRNGIDVTISSLHGEIRLDVREKHGFSDVETLHALVGPPRPDLVGTDVRLDGISDDDVATATRFFLRFDPTVTVVESTPYGEVLRRSDDEPSAVYVRGVRVADDDVLLFSYNVTKLDAKLRKAMNRERSNVGRTAYTDRVKAILLAVEGAEALTALAADMEGFAKGETHDEVKWTDVAERVVVELARVDATTVFVTAKERWSHPELVRRAEDEGRTVFVIPDALASRLAREGNEHVMTLGRFVHDWNQRVVIEPLDESVLTDAEREVLALATAVLRVAVGDAGAVPVVVSETLHLTPDGRETADGLWEPARRRIVVNRTCLGSRHRFVSTVLHELGHAVTGATDLTPAFEDGLTELLGVTGLAAVDVPFGT
jgi:hypothetical protein